ncbi:peptidyl-prolyl cis-trans isomerase [Sulfurimonas crateris]|uniref:Peptidyl-prolyl cis-trans isomerase n=1 Tax=Sulfurimonas crateris TaxID=2574727 RepID=A0A4U2ZBR3_9BACT|nr:peptidylprolyl isomerase [Sulfurimonas crateris]TKI71000.1 peptidyl-prolyl cis-trans isomerase [Sulfurimonas crateris]
MYKILLSLFIGAMLNAELINGVGVVVKGEPITLYDIKEEMKISRLDAQSATDSLIRKKLEEAEIEERKISVTSSEVYDDIKKTAMTNKMSIDELYEAVRNSNGLTSTEFKAKTKEKLLSQKLYSAIAYSSIDTPSEDELKEYYELHKDEFLRPSAFDVTIYSSKNRNALEKKTTIPMFHSDEIKMDEQILEYGRISPELSRLLENTQLNTFTPVVSEPNGMFVSFYLKEVKVPSSVEYEGVKNQIMNLIMSQKREQVLSDHFARLRNSADIKIIREL